MKNNKILIVDDEICILKSLKRSLPFEEFQIETFENPLEALNFLKTYQPAVIISDMRMPVMDGIEFLINAQSICPDSIRIVLSGYSDINKILAAINKNHIYRYVSKPWDNIEITAIIRQAMDYYQALRDRDELTLKVFQQNKELKMLNEKLEQMVEERMLELQTRDNILNHLLEVHPLETSIHLILSQIQKLYRFESIVFYSKSTTQEKDIIYSLKNDVGNIVNNSDSVKKELPLIIDNQKYFNLMIDELLILRKGNDNSFISQLSELLCPGGDVFSVAVKNSNSKFGLLLCGSYEADEYLRKIYPKISGFANYLAIALHDNIQCEDIYSLKNNVNEILKVI